MAITSESHLRNHHECVLISFLLVAMVMMKLKGKEGKEERPVLVYCLTGLDPWSLWVCGSLVCHITSIWQRRLLTSGWQMKRGCAQCPQPGYVPSAQSPPTRAHPLKNSCDLELRVWALPLHQIVFGYYVVYSQHQSNFAGFSFIVFLFSISILPHVSQIDFFPMFVLRSGEAQFFHLLRLGRNCPWCSSCLGLSGSQKSWFVTKGMGKQPNQRKFKSRDSRGIIIDTLPGVLHELCYRQFLLYKRSHVICHLAAVS